MAFKLQRLSLSVGSGRGRPTKATHVLTFISRFLHAGIAGALMYLSYEPTGWWFCAIIGAGGLYLVTRPWSFTKPTVLGGAILGFTQGMTLYLLLLPWINSLVGNMPYIALCVFLSLYNAVFGAGAVILLRHRHGVWFFPFWYVAVEAARSSFPFGGFSWVRLSWGQVQGPLMSLAPIGGPVLVTFATVGLGIIFILWTGRIFSRRFKSSAMYLLSFVLILAVSQAGLFYTRAERLDKGTVTVAAIQGNVPRMGLDYNAQRRAVLANHVRQTEATDPEGVDFTVWPENASDVDPFQDQAAYNGIMEAVEHMGGPILVGELTRDEVGDRNRVQVWNPGTGPGEYHDKKYLQPFGEYMPWRSFFRKITDLVDLASDFKAGTGNGVVNLRAATSGINVAVGVLTCYEIASDKGSRDAVNNGAQILVSPTNNATFGFSDMTYQQLAISRFRAEEFDRSVVVAATSGVSAMIDPDGNVLSWVRIFQPASLTETLPLRADITLAARISYYLEWLLSIIGLLSLVIFSYRRK
ncbi:MAG: apolipoprotein N-acyltransferase [Corynebacterium sp.]|nr:apolipoprotein N-acyltransferase [Corynebacterium sp.]